MFLLINKIVKTYCRGRKTVITDGIRLIGYYQL